MMYYFIFTSVAEIMWYVFSFMENRCNCAQMFSMNTNWNKVESFAIPSLINWSQIPFRNRFHRSAYVEDAVVWIDTFKA